MPNPLKKNRSFQNAWYRIMKVLLYLPKLDKGGPDKVILNLANTLANQGVNTHVLVQESGGYYWDRLENAVECSAMILQPSLSAIKAYPVREYAAHIHEIKPDVVLSTLRSTMTSAIARMTRQASVPLILRPANHLTMDSQKLLRQNPLKHSLSWGLNIACLHAADHIVCQSHELYADFRRYQVPAKSMSIIGNPIDLPSQCTLANLGRMQLKGNPSLVAVGRLSYQKGFDILIKAVSLLKDIQPHLTLDILGEGEERSTLEALVSRYGLQNRINLHGYTDRPEAWMAQADLVISSSRYEGFPNVVLEALAHGTPVIATDCPGGTRELVVPGLTGWLCQPESPEALAQTIVRAWGSQPLESENIRQFIHSKFSREIISQKYLELFQNILAHKVN